MTVKQNLYKMNTTFYIIDGSSYIFRAYYAVQSGLTNKDNMPTGAIFGFKNMLIKLIAQTNPSHMVMVFDPIGKTFRNDIYDGYKANRGETPRDLKIQFLHIHKFVELMNIPIIIPENYEADDAIASLAKKFHNEITLKIISGDKDLMQLVSDKVYVVDTMKNIVYDKERVFKKFGVYPAKIKEYLSLVGDSSDNIPGAEGVGAKTAVKLLNEFGNIENIYDNLDKISGKLKEKIKNSKQRVEMSLQLVEMNSSLAIKGDLSDFLYKIPHYQQLKEFYKEMGFRDDNFLKTGTQQQLIPSQPALIQRENYILIDTKEKLEYLIKSIQQKKIFIFDLETTSLTVQDSQIVGIAFMVEEEIPCYISFSHQRIFELNEILQKLSPVFTNKEITIIGHNIKYDIMVLKNYNVEIENKIEDTILISYLLNADSHAHSLDKLSLKYFDHQMISYNEVTLGKNFKDVSIDEALKYAGEDVDITFRLYKLLKPQLKKNKLEELYRKLEIPLIKILAEMEMKGVKIDTKIMRSISDEYKKELTDLQKKIYQEAGEEFNINSPAQLSHILFNKLNINKFKKKIASGYSTDIKVLTGLANEYPIAQYLIEYRNKNKLINTYLDVLPTLVHKTTQRIHTSYNQTIAATGRLSSQNPNLQNIPIKGTEGNRVRKTFIAEQSYNLISADYSQIELRILAHLSEDQNLITAFNEELDIHSQTASFIFNSSVKNITHEQRRCAKTINFGIIYGMGAFRLSQTLNISRNEATEFISTYFKKYPNIEEYFDSTIKFAQQNGYVKTIFGRKRYIKGIDDSNIIRKKAAERIAINTRIQGTAADIIKKAMIDITTPSQPPFLSMIMQVHDELVFEVQYDYVKEATQIIRDKMEQTHILRVPLTVEVKYGTNWAEAH